MMDGLKSNRATDVVTDADRPPGQGRTRHATRGARRADEKTRWNRINLVAHVMVHVVGIPICVLIATLSLWFV